MPYYEFTIQLYYNNDKTAKEIYGQIQHDMDIKKQDYGISLLVKVEREVIN